MNNFKDILNRQLNESQTLNEYRSKKLFSSFEEAIKFIKKFKNSNYFDEFSLTHYAGEEWEFTYTYND